MKKYTLLYSGITLLALVGVLDAGYLSVTALSGEVPLCNFIHGCDAVALSPYSRVFGIPLALFGVFFYAVIGGFSLWGLFDKKAGIRIFLIPFTAIGFLLSLYFLYLQAFIIQAYCEYCLFSLLDATILFVLSFFIPKERKGILEPNVQSG